MKVAPVRDLLGGLNIFLHHLVASTGQVTDPCDADHHGSNRARINALLLQRSSTKPLTGDEKIAIMSEAYQSATESSIRDHFRHCGLIGDEDPTVAASRLIEDHSRRAVSNYHAHHEAQLERYLESCRSRGRKVRDRPGRIGPWWDAIRRYTRK